MNDLEKALSELQAIRQQVVRTVTFRGFGPQVLGFTALVAVAAAAVQHPLLGTGKGWPYLVYWACTALVAVAAIATEAVRRARHTHADMADDMLWSSLWQFVPPLATGAAVGVVLLRVDPALVWLLPGVWQIFVAMGVFAATASLPMAMRLVGAWYLLAGLFCIALGDRGTPSPLLMGFPFIVGQGLAAFVMYQNERGQDVRR